MRNIDIKYDFLFIFPKSRFVGISKQKYLHFGKRHKFTACM